MTDDTVRAGAAALPAQSKDADEEHATKSEAFQRAYHAWLKARAAKEDPEWPDDEQAGKQRFIDERETGRRVFMTPAVDREQLWGKLEVFEAVLANELMVGQSVDAIVFLGLGAIKDDLLNLDIAN
jgi:hypothetical protein